MQVSIVSQAETQEEQQQWLGWRCDRDVRAREALIGRYLAFARSVAARLYSLRIDDSIQFEDYLQHARIGLLEAVDRFDPGRGVPFKTFANRRVRGAILNGLDRDTERAAQHRYHVDRVQERMESIKSARTQPGLGGLVEITVNLALGLVLDSESEPEDESPESNPYAVTEVAQLKRRIAEAIDRLPERERWIVQQHYVNGFEFQEIAAALQLTKGRISQLHSRAIGRIRESVAGNVLSRRF